MFEFLSLYWQSVFVTAGVLAIAAIGLQITIGSGQFSVMHGTLMGLGGYAGGWAARDLGWPFIATLFVGAAAGAIVGLLASFVLRRLRGLILGIATLAIGEGLAIVARNFFPGRAQGYSGIPLRTSLMSVVIVLLLVLLFVTRLRHTRLGMALTAVGSDDVAGESLGMSLIAVKLWGFAIGGGIAGIAGAMNAQFLGLVVPHDLSFAVEIRLLIFVILGGMLSPFGAAIGAIAVTVGEEVLREFSSFDRQWMLGLLLVIAVMLRPEGFVDRLKLRSKRWLPKPLAESVDS